MQGIINRWPLSIALIVAFIIGGALAMLILPFNKIKNTEGVMLGLLDVKSLMRGSFGETLTPLASSPVAASNACPPKQVKLAYNEMGVDLSFPKFTMTRCPSSPPIVNSPSQEDRAEGEQMDAATAGDPLEVNPQRTQGPSKLKPNLKLISHPMADVFLGRRFLGRTPLKTTVPSGKWPLNFVNKRLGLKTVRWVQVKKRKNLSTFVFGKGKIRFHLVPGRIVYFDERRLGASPLHPVWVYEGNHSIAVVEPSSGQRQHFQVAVKPQKTTWVSQMF
jgi:hypothetical protein